MTPPIAEDILDGAKAIAEYLGMDVRRVYHIRAAGGPIRKLASVGIYAFRSELDGWLTAPETLPQAVRGICAGS